MNYISSFQPRLILFSLFVAMISMANSCFDDPPKEPTYAGEWRFVTYHFDGQLLEGDIEQKGDTLESTIAMQRGDFTFKGHLDTLTNLMSGKYTYDLFPHNAKNASMTIQFISPDKGKAKFWVPQLEMHIDCDVYRQSSDEE